MNAICKIVPDLIDHSSLCIHNYAFKLTYLCLMEERLDKLLIQRKLVSTRGHAEKMIREVGVKVDGKLISKSGKKFTVDCTIEIIAEETPWVSRDAVKLTEAIQQWDLDIENKVFMDIAAGAGGITQVLLENKAKKVYCMDLEKDKLNVDMAINSRTVILENTHVRELTNKIIPELVDGCVIDVTDTSLENIFPFIHPFIKNDGVIIAVVKPQYEVDKKKLGKGRLVKDKKLHKEVIDRVIHCGATNQMIYKAHISSPILGNDGNHEFLIKLIKETK
ncbi:MAG: TlyA family RNA methyltransferase [Crocinitomicaceae bacterium]|nr:TlyA family RNA methyltransferase [Crocinitomicaceae bacterium]